MCDFCGRMFTQISSRNVHLRRRHCHLFPRDPSGITEPSCASQTDSNESLTVVSDENATTMDPNSDEGLLDDGLFFTFNSFSATIVIK